MSTRVPAIVTTTYRYKRPSRKRKPVEIDGPAIVRKQGGAGAVAPPAPGAEPAPGNDNHPEVRRKSRLSDAPDLTPEEFQRRGEAADAMWSSLVGRATAKDEKSAAAKFPASAESEKAKGGDPRPPTRMGGGPSPIMKPASVVTARRRRRDGPHLPVELPLSHKPIERAGDDYRRLKAAMAQRLRGADE